MLESTPVPSNVYPYKAKKPRQPVAPMCPAPIRLLRLGMPHMGPDGVSHGWFLRQACHAHWDFIAAHLDVRPPDFLDMSGARVLPSVVACTINGDATKFREDEACKIFLTERPTEQNGWRSQLDLRNDHGNSIRAEIITAFARRAGPSNRDLEPAQLGPEFTADPCSADMRRTSIIRRLGNAMRVQAKADLDPPHRVVAVDPIRHINAVGLVYFAAMHDSLEALEQSALPHLIQAWPMRDRRVHYFGNLDVGDSLELTSRASVQALAPSGSVVVQSHGRRASDKKVIVASESIYAP